MGKLADILRDFVHVSYNFYFRYNLIHNPTDLLELMPAAAKWPACKFQGEPTSDFSEMVKPISSMPQKVDHGHSWAPLLKSPENQLSNPRNPDLLVL